MKIVRYALWGLVAAIAATFAWLYFTGGLNSQKLTTLTTAKLGGEFSLIRHDGSPITDQDLLGKPHVMFFGFTNCPEICPTTLYETSLWLEELGSDGDKIGVYFVSVDPERDQPEFLAEYLTSFDPRIIGITGDKEEISKMLRAYKVFSRRVELDDGDYTMDHTATIYLLNSKGEFVRSIAYGENQESAVAKLRKLIDKE